MAQARSTSKNFSSLLPSRYTSSLDQCDSRKANSCAQRGCTTLLFRSTFATSEKRQKFRLQWVQCRGWPSWKALRVNALQKLRFEMRALQVAAEGKKDPFVEAQKAFNMFDTDGSGICE
jgi:hypothetical protein